MEYPERVESQCIPRNIGTAHRNCSFYKRFETDSKKEISTGTVRITPDTVNHLFEHPVKVTSTRERHCRQQYEYPSFIKLE